MLKLKFSLAKRIISTEHNLFADRAIKGHMQDDGNIENNSIPCNANTFDTPIAIWKYERKPVAIILRAYTLNSSAGLSH